MVVYADLIFDAQNAEGDVKTFRIVTKFHNREQMEAISERYLFDDIWQDIEMILPLGYTIDSEIEFGEIYTIPVSSYQLDLSWVNV